MIKWVIVEQTMMGRHVAKRGLSFATEAEARAYIDTVPNPRWRARLRVESRKIELPRTGPKMHCQCCMRHIEANQGYIAHHGYTRRQGWQTPSCFGAKKLPWEADRSALAELIKFLDGHLVKLITAHTKVRDEEMPVTVEYSLTDRRTFKKVPKSVTFTRATFDAVRAETKDAFPFYRSSETFDDYKKRDLARRQSDIDHVRRDLTDFNRRYNSWAQTHEWQNDQWRAL